MTMKPIDYYEISEQKEFLKNVHRLVKKKRFVSLPGQLMDLEEALSRGEFSGELLSHGDEPEPYDLYKLRLPNPDANAGKSDGYRVIYLVVTEEKIVVLLTIYYKKEQEDVTDTYVMGLIDGYFMGSLPYDDA